ncbi:MAG: TetR family transcriptional regulator [Alphaproteobacteria bacterium]
MPKPKRATARTAQPTVATRDRILNAAIWRFANHSYEETGLRHIAADASVDVAYVHRLFGSKEELFVEALLATTQPDRIVAESATDPATTLARELFRRDDSDEVRPLDIAVRSFTSSKASGVMREFVLRHFIGPLAQQFGPSTDRQAALAIAFMTGVAILRNVLHVDCLLETSDGQLERRIADALAYIIAPRSDDETA